MNQVDFGKVSSAIESVFGTTTESIAPVKMELSQSVFVIEVSSVESKNDFQKVYLIEVNSRDIGCCWGHFDRMI